MVVSRVLLAVSLGIVMAVAGGGTSHHPATAVIHKLPPDSAPPVRVESPSAAGVARIPRHGPPIHPLMNVGS